MSTRLVISAIIIQDKKILVVQKNKTYKTWILPGGKPEDKESDLECLVRESQEELPGIELDNFRFYGAFEGIAPHNKDWIRVNTYFVTMTNGFEKPAKEINNYAWASYKDLKNYNLAEPTRKAITNLRRQKYL